MSLRIAVFGLLAKMGNILRDNVQRARVVVPLTCVRKRAITAARVALKTGHSLILLFVDERLLP